MNTKKITSFLLLFVVCFSIIPFTGILAKENTTDSNKSTRKEQNCIPGHVDINCGAVIVSFIDQNGNKILNDDSIDVQVGATYDINLEELPIINGYEYTKYTEDSAPLHGIINTIDETLYVTFVYDGVKNQEVVHYVNQDGKKLADDEVLTGKNGDTYKSSKKDFSSKGYKFLGIKNDSDAIKGLFLPTNKGNITYVYGKSTTPKKDDNTVENKELPNTGLNE